MEVCELKDLFDEKDEKIDFLFKMYGYRQMFCGDRVQLNVLGVSLRFFIDMRSLLLLKEDIFWVQVLLFLLGVEDLDLFFMGLFSGRFFVGMLQ